MSFRKLSNDISTIAWVPARHTDSSIHMTPSSYPFSKLPLTNSIAMLLPLLGLVVAHVIGNAKPTHILNQKHSTKSDSLSVDPVSARSLKTIAPRGLTMMKTLQIQHAGGSRATQHNITCASLVRTNLHVDVSVQVAPGPQATAAWPHVLLLLNHLHCSLKRGVAPAVRQC